jgi:hypothetical protein
MASCQRSLTAPRLSLGGVTGTDNLTTTEITTPGLSVAVLSSGNPLPGLTVVGAGGRMPPSTVIEDDATGSVGQPATRSEKHALVVQGEKAMGLAGLPAEPGSRTPSQLVGRVAAVRVGATAALRSSYGLSDPRAR